MKIRFSYLSLFQQFIDEVNRERSFFKYILEHKQTERTMQTQSLSLGMILLQPDMKQLLNVSKHSSFMVNSTTSLNNFHRKHAENTRIYGLTIKWK